MPDLTCLRDYGDNTCQGPVSTRLSYAGTGTPINECAFHMDESGRRNEEHMRNYPDSDQPPSWFDPTYAGERWNEDD